MNHHEPSAPLDTFVSPVKEVTSAKYVNPQAALNIEKRDSTSNYSKAETLKGRTWGLGESNSACCVHIYSYTGAREMVNIDKVYPQSPYPQRLWILVQVGRERQKIKNRHVIHNMANRAIKKDGDEEVEYHTGCLSFLLTGKASSSPNTIHTVNACSSFRS